MGSHSFCTRSPVCLADTVAERQPSANHTMRTMPPSLSAAYCMAHDEGIWSTAKGLLGGVPDECEEEAHALATLPMRMGGLGLRSAVRCAPSAFWASWADSIQMIHQRTPDVAIAVVRRLSDEGPLDGCLEELREAATEWQPSWAELRDGKRPPQNDARDPGEWPHGWQYWASSVSDTHYRRFSMLIAASRRAAHLRSHSGAQCWHCLVPRTHGTRVHCSSTPLPGVVAGATGPSIACH